MLKLYGGSLSNYYCMAKAGLLEKGLEFEEVGTSPSQDADFLAKSPMGKIPCLQTDSGFLTETVVILDYLEDIQPEPPLLPADPYARAKARELAQSLALYVELAARRGYGALRGNVLPDERKEPYKAELERGIAAIARLTQFSPWIAGDTFTYADIVAYFTFQYAQRAAEANVELDLLGALPGAAQWHELAANRDSIKETVAGQRR